MTSCFECGEPAEYDHHVVPQARGGTKTVPLCGGCHAKAHHLDKRMSTAQLTKEGIARAKARGAKIGRPENLNNRGRLLGSRAAAVNRAAMAITAYADITPDVLQWRSDGETLQAIADRLNATGRKTRQGKTWKTTQVIRVLRRASA